MLSIFRSTPKWQSPKARTRIEALANLRPGHEQDNEIRLKLARDDADAGVRRQAVLQLDDPDVVAQIQKREADESVREAAGQRLHALLAGKSTPSLPLTQRLEHINRLTGAPLLLALVQDADSLDIRLAALARLRDEDTLASIVRDSAIARLRQAAAEGIHSTTQLEALAKATQQKDKNVYRILRGRLDEQARQEKSARQLQEKRDALCLAMEAHARAALNPLYAAKTESLRQQWQELDAASGNGAEDSAQSERFETALALAHAQVREIELAEQRAADQARARDEQQQCIATLEATLEEYQGQDDFDLPAFAALRKTQHLRWELALKLQPAPAALLERHSHLTARLEALEKLLLQWQQDRLVIEATLAGLPEADAGEQALSLQTLNALRENYRAHGFPLPALLRDIPGLPVADAPHEPAPQKQSKEQSKEQQKKLDGLLDTLAREIEAGNSRQAARQLRRARDFSKEHHLHSARFAELAERVRELQSWAGFAVQPKKEALIVRMQALAGHAMDPDDKADAIHALQEEWKALGLADASVEQPLWEQFKAAADTAFEPCRAHFAAQRELRQQNLEKRQALCEQLQSYLDALPEAPDWKAHEAILRTARQEWQQYNPSERQHTRAVQEHFHALLKALEAPWLEARKKNETAKRELVTRAIALGQDSDTRAACDKARQLQQEWKTVGQAHPKADRQLWQEFRGACDALFSKRDAEFQARQAERDAQVTQAEALITSLAELATPDAAALRSAVERLDDAFQALSLPREKAASLRDRFQAARRKVEQAAREQQVAAQREKREDVLRQWETVEQTGTPADPDKADSLLLDLEILLDLPTPEPWQTARRERQMQQLQSRGLRKAGHHEAHTLLADLLKTPAPVERRADATARLRQVLEKLG